VHGDTDSERLFAMITREIRRHDGDVRAGIVAGVGWIAAHLPIYSLNLIVTTATEVFALRYPDTNTLYVLERPAGGGALRHHSSLGTRVHSEEAAQRPVVVLASEPMDDDPGWRALESGELLHVGPELEVSSAIALPDPPAQMLDLSTLGEQGRSSQETSAGA
jgi:glutamine amidotransferase